MLRSGMPAVQPTPTSLTATDHDHAYDFFNARLFSHTLPRCLITLSSGRKHAAGYFRPTFFSQDRETEVVDEIGMNPEHFKDLTTYLSTLVHEMAHLWQARFGKTGRRGYHNRAWASKMLELGLSPFNVAHPEEMTGIRVSHTIMAGGPFEVACQALLATGFSVRWKHVPGELPEEALEEPEPEDPKVALRKEQKKASKTPFHCPKCGMKAWSKPTSRLMCAPCRADLIPSEPPASD
jgi:hypothetical protein